jgi:hypothetical protein
MTISEAIIVALENAQWAITPTQIYNIIKERNLYDFSKNTAPENTINSIVRSLIDKGDTRLKRIKIDRIEYRYYLAKYETNINFNSLQTTTPIQTNNYKEQDLHKLFTSYLESKGINAKTIFHEKKQKEDERLKWRNPDIVGVQLIDLDEEVANNFLKSINKEETFKLFSFELKREINYSYELQMAYFQAVSNSSWANYGYLVAYDVNDILLDQIERLNQSFGIGFIKLNANPYRSKILFQAAYKKMDMITINSICRQNRDFRKFIEIIEKLLNADKKYYNEIEKELLENCDDCFFDNDLVEIRKYCENKNIPFEEDIFKED